MEKIARIELFNFYTGCRALIDSIIGDGVKVSGGIVRSVNHDEQLVELEHEENNVTRLKYVPVDSVSPELLHFCDFTDDHFKAILKMVKIQDQSFDVDKFSFLGYHLNCKQAVFENGWGYFTIRISNNFLVEYKVNQSHNFRPVDNYFEILLVIMKAGFNIGNLFSNCKN